MLKGLVVLLGGIVCLPIAAAREDLGSCTAEQNQVHRPPNIILILADDLGYGDLSCYGATEIETPNIDRMARGGLRFTNGYCSASTCTPTRYSLLTGKYAFRVPGTGVAPPNAPAIIQPGTETMPGLLRQAGYRTGVIGKWHLGLGQNSRTAGSDGRVGPDWNNEIKPGPLEIGFDTCFLLPTTNDRVPQVYVQDHRVVNLDPDDPLWVGDRKPSDDHPTGLTHRGSLKMDWSHGHNQTIHNGISRIGFYTGGQAARFRDEDLADKWVEKSLEFMEENQDRPFFLYFASHDIHVPRVPHERFQGKTKLGWRGDAILQLDWSVGELISAVEKLGLAENTLIVFCSDNGPVMDDGYQDQAIDKVGSHRAAGPFSGGKYSVFEGGTRTPFITYWAGTIRPGESSQMVSTIDLARSFADLAKQPVPPAALPDSQNVLAALVGQPGARGRDHVVQQNNPGNALGLRMLVDGRDWKLHHTPAKQTYNLNINETLKSTAVPEFQLFDLAADPAEKSDLSEKHPDILQMLSQRLKDIRGEGAERPQK